MPKQILAVLCIFALAACASRGTVPEKNSGGFSASQLAKSDIDRFAAAHPREVFANLRALAEKLYRRNPAELKKHNRASVAAGVARIFDEPHAWNLAELQGKRGAQAIQLHGGIGLTHEHNCHLFMKRAMLNAQLSGGGDHWREAAGRQALAQYAAA